MFYPYTRFKVSEVLSWPSGDAYLYKWCVEHQAYEDTDAGYPEHSCFDPFSVYEGDEVAHFVGEILPAKRKDEGYSGLLASIRDEGLEESPIAMYDKDGRLTLVNGHHRMAALVDLGIDEVEIEINTDFKVGE